tara:strand:+ start:1896 stop:2045 length:150 start_codon:yes stop_codon:yes gene_type:complete
MVTPVAGVADSPLAHLRGGLNVSAAFLPKIILSLEDKVTPAAITESVPL